MRPDTELKFLDANIALRFLTRDHPKHSAAVLPLFEQLEKGALRVTTSEGVIIEIVQVLASRALYNLDRSEIREHMAGLLGLRGLILADRPVFLRALELFAESNVDIVDAMIVARMERQGIKVVLSFDRDLDRFPTIERQEPRAETTGSAE